MHEANPTAEVLKEKMPRHLEEKDFRNKPKKSIHL